MGKSETFVAAAWSSSVKTGDLARLKDLGTMSGEIVLVLRVRPLGRLKSDVLVVDFIYKGELQEEFHIDFFELVQGAHECGKIEG
jgi:hypothetical protein